MKLTKLIVTIVFVFVECNVTFSTVLTDKRIMVNKNEHLLTAPFAKSFQWYFNDQKLSNTNRDLKIMGTGIYKVEMTDENGVTSSTSVKIVVDESGEVYSIYTIGDSTVQDYSSGYYPRKGWGQVLQYFFKSDVTVINKAVGGTSAKSFYDSFWTPIKNVLQPGDYVLIQFGINDAKKDDPARYTIPFTTFQEYLTKFVNETKEKGAVPVLVATLRRNAWENDSTVYDAYHDYPVATRQLASTLNVPLIDLDQMSVPLMEGLGPYYTGPFMYMRLDAGEYPNYPSGITDDVHFQEMGAIEMARLVIESISDMDADTNMNKLLPFIKPMKQVSVTANFPDGAIITRTESYPEGLTVTVKAKMNNGYGFIEWQDAEENQLTTNEMYSFVMDTTDLSFIAILDDDPQNLDCAGKNFGTAYIDSCGTCVGGTSGKFPCTIDISSDTFKIKPVHSNLCVEESSGIVQNTCSDNSSQSWMFIKEGNYYKIQNVASGQYLYSSNLVSGDYISASSTPLLWLIENVSEGIYQLVPADNQDVVVDVYGKRVTSGAKLLLYSRNNNDNQRFKFVIIEPVGIRKELSDKKISVLPNPFSNEITIKINDTKIEPVSIRAFNIQGIEVFNVEEINTGEISFGSNLPKGIYIVQIINKGGLSQFRILKN